MTSCVMNDKIDIRPYSMQLYRVRRKAFQEVKGKHTISYKDFAKLGWLLRERNPSSVMKIIYKMRIALNPNPIFKRFFICL